MDSLFIYIYNLVLLLYCDLLLFTPSSGEEPDRDSNLGWADQVTGALTTRPAHLTGPLHFTKYLMMTPTLAPQNNFRLLDTANCTIIWKVCVSHIQLDLYCECMEHC